MAKQKKKAKKSELMIKKSLVQDYIKSKGDYRISRDSFETLSDFVMDLCDEAMERSEMNKRKTIQPQDF